MKIFGICSFLLLSFINIQSQVLPDSSSKFLNASAKVFNINIETKSFFKNNEYFNPIEEGYSLLGLYAEPKIYFQPYDNFRLSAGGCFLKYSGREEFTLTELLFRVQYQPVKWFQVIMGNIYGANHHKLYEPLYQWEKAFSKPVENGLQFLFNTSFMDADVWLNWEKFIFHGDAFQEELTVGIRSDFLIPPFSGNTKLVIPLQVIFQHHGGQINAGNDTIETIANWGTGLHLMHRTQHNFFKRFDLELLYFGYSDLSPTKRQFFFNGYNLYPKGKLYLGNFIIDAGYFYGNKFAAPMGEGLFHSINIPYSGESRKNVKLITTKLIFSKIIHPGIVLGAYAETYSDLKANNTDYDYGMHILFNMDLFR
jgi:hypothetical protein